MPYGQRVSVCAYCNFIYIVYNLNLCIMYEDITTRALKHYYTSQMIELQIK